MKAKAAVLALLLALALPITLMADDGGTPYGQGKDPKIVLPEATFTFDTVLEGETVVHSFPVKNEGQADLVVEKVRTG